MKNTKDDYYSNLKSKNHYTNKAIDLIVCFKVI